MKNPANPIGPSWSASPKAKVRNAIQRSVTALLDELAPERVLKRVEALHGSVEQHRTPNGCILQAAEAAVSVSWFADSGNDSVLGELHVVVWRGSVQRRGAPKNRKGATLVAELVLRPIEPPANELIWESTDGTRYDTTTLTAKILTLLEDQIGAGT